MFLFSKRFIIGLLALSLHTQASSQDNQHLQQLVTKAIDLFEQTGQQHWRYQVSRYENEEGDIHSSIELYNPSTTADVPWTLIKLNGKPASIKQQTAFQDKKRQQKNSHTIELSKLIKLSSLTMLAEGTEQLTLGFKVTMTKLGKQATDKLYGQLFYNKSAKFIEKISITNTDEFSPMLAATIEQFELIFHFIKIENSILTQQQSMKMRGNFAYFTDIDEVSTDTFSDYQRVEVTNTAGQ